MDAGSGHLHGAVVESGAKVVRVERVELHVSDAGGLGIEGDRLRIGISDILQRNTTAVVSCVLCCACVRAVRAAVEAKGRVMRERTQSFIVPSCEPERRL